MPDILVDNKHIYNFELFFIDSLKWVTITTVFLFILGFLNSKPLQFLEFNFVVKLFLGIFLIYRFNSFRKDKVKFTELDRKVCSSVGFYVITLSFIDIINSYTEKIKEIVSPYTIPIVSKVKNILP